MSTAGEVHHCVSTQAKQVSPSWARYLISGHALAIFCHACMLLTRVQYMSLSLLRDLASSASKTPSCRMASGFQNL